MLNLKQLSYVNLGLQDRFKCAYYSQHEDGYYVFINSSRCRGMYLFGIKFEQPGKAKYFADNYMKYDKYDFDVILQRNNLMIAPKTINGVIQIDCQQNEEIAKKLVKVFRSQFMQHLNNQKIIEKINKKDSKGLQF